MNVTFGGSEADSTDCHTLFRNEHNTFDAYLQPLNKTAEKCSQICISFHSLLSVKRMKAGLKADAFTPRLIAAAAGEMHPGNVRQVLNGSCRISTAAICSLTER